MRTIEITFGAGETAELGGGNFFQYLRGEDPIEVTFYRGSARLVDESTTLARPGYKAAPMRQVPRGQSQGEPVGFTSITLKSDTAQTIEVGVSMGEGGYNRFTGDSEITAPLDGDGHVETADAKLIALLKNAIDQRAPLTTLEGTTKASVVNSTNEVVSAEANINGVIIRTASVAASAAAANAGSESNSAKVRVDGTTLIVARAKAKSDTTDGSGSGSASGDSIKDIFVPAGEAVEIQAGATSEAAIAYKVL